ncbi:MAG: AAA family ATPase [Prevotellaceae bacterium]|nr:AAA family ATPase [Prevotellaceae bacterium]
MKTSELQDFLYKKKGVKDLFEYYIELTELLEPQLPAPKPVIPDTKEETSFTPYTKADFLREVFMDEASFDTLRQLVETKKNVILQGAPGVGKTFCACRLAQAIMGEKDDNRIELIQFHQNYAYEDFVMGYKPAGNSFELKEGVFYRFCKRAEKDPGHAYFFIIDEINRGNLSKIFGELLMLIENDYHGQAVTLAYRDERFSVPKNLYLIGMMNTADRSLALIDYALRRRFSFFEMRPAFDSDGFKAYLKAKDNARLDELTARLKELNREIAGDASLGSGFEIGHSYLCTGGAVTDEWLRAVVKYDILPMLQEYWFDNKEKVKEWANKLGGIFHD